MDISKLAAEFPRDAVHWRAQTLTRNGDKALALAYLDARDVMDRLDEVCGPENWQSEYVETARGRVICRIGVYFQDCDDWVWKSDGAGDTAVEGEKGGISDAFKRAAVHWGIGRYLYRLDAVWCPCETYERNGKKHWSKWSADPWDFVRSAPQKPKKPEPSKPSQEEIDTAIDKVASCSSMEELGSYWQGLNKNSKHVAAHKDVIAEKDAKKAELAGRE
jgi:hypothetical protein